MEYAAVPDPFDLNTVHSRRRPRPQEQGRDPYDAGSAPGRPWPMADQGRSYRRVWIAALLLQAGTAAGVDSIQVKRIRNGGVFHDLRFLSMLSG